MIGEYLGEHWVEIAGTILSLIYLYLSIKQKIGLWIFGFLCSAMYVVVFFQSKFYADMSLQIYYVAVSIYGWFSWKKGSDKAGSDIPVRRTKPREAVMLTLITIVILLFYYYILKNLTDSPLPFADSFTTALSITATWMLTKKMIEHWLIWVVVDVVSAGLYVYRDLHVTAFLFIVYTFMAVVGFIQWKKSMNMQ